MCLLASVFSSEDAVLPLLWEKETTRNESENSGAYSLCSDRGTILRARVRNTTVPYLPKCISKDEASLDGV